MVTLLWRGELETTILALKLAKFNMNVFAIFELLKPG